MSLSIISDVHIKSSGDAAEKLLLNFLNNKKVLESEYIVLLGDIFDLMVGPHKEYFDEYPNFFLKLDELIANGNKIIYIEGNHDFHLKKLFNLRYSKSIGSILEIIETSTWKIVSGKKVYLSHGDDLELDNYSYRAYKWLINTPPFKHATNHVISYELISGMGRKASSTSKNRGQKNYNPRRNKDSFRFGAISKMKLGFDIVVGGHSHIKDLHENENGIYVNNGFALTEKTFININDSLQISFEPLD